MISHTLTFIALSGKNTLEEQNDDVMRQLLVD